MEKGPHSKMISGKGAECLGSLLQTGGMGISQPGFLRHLGLYGWDCSSNPVSVKYSHPTDGLQDFCVSRSLPALEIKNHVRAGKRKVFKKEILILKKVSLQKNTIIHILRIFSS